jgi:crossover junction endodeoxyribonuclease RuvC
MNIIAIDPGYDRCGVAILSQEHGKPTLHYSTCITTDKKLTFPERMHTVHTECVALVEKYACASMALERLYFNTNQKTAMHVAEVRGMLIQIASSAGITVSEYTPPQIKSAVTGSGAAPKAALIKMVPLLVKMDARKRLDDEYDAIAIGLTHLACVRK